MFLVQVLPWASVPIAAIVFLGVLGGAHPSNAQRDLVIRAALAIVVGLQLPPLWALWRRTAKQSVGTALALLAMRLVICVPPLLFAGGVSHEAPREGPADR